MQLFRWSKTHEVYLPEIDAEHRVLFQRGSELYKAILAGAEPDRLSALLADLLQAATDHFEHEERLMRSAHFPSLAWHKQQHDAVRKRASECIARIDAGESEARIELLKFLSSWMRDHLSVADRMMGAYLRNWQRRTSAIAS